MFRTLAIAALIALSLGAAPAAQPAVRFGDLNLASPADAAVLKGRIARAAAQACAVTLDFGVSARLITESRLEEKACIARVSVATLAKVQALASARVSTATRLARQ